MPAVFISYSRKDFYFAESLAFHLNRRDQPAWLDANQLSPGIDWQEKLDRALDSADCVVLIVSRESVRSEYVRAEWQRARSLKKRIIAAVFRSAQLPSELGELETVSFRSSFGRGLKKLTETINTPPPLHHSLGRSRPRIPLLPPWVALTGLLLASLFLLPLILFGDWHFTDESMAMRIAIILFLPFFFAFIAWHTWVAFLRRRMGMTRLTIMIGLFTGIFAFNLAKRFGFFHTDTPGETPTAFNAISIPILCAIVFLGLVAFAILFLVRPEDLLRWTPTGKAWEFYRRQRVHQVPAIPTRFAETKRFRLFYDADDENSATRLRQELEKAGSIEASAGADATAVLLLTNLTSSEWLTQQSHHLRGNALPVVASAINLPDSIRWLWRRQWIDFRNWNTRAKKAAGPAVPEGFARLVLPSGILKMQHLLCALSALVFNFTGIFFPDAKVGEPSAPVILTCVGVIGVCLTLGWAVLAWRLSHRRIRKGVLVWLALFLFAGSIALALGWFFNRPPGVNFPRIVPAAIFLVAAPLWLARLLREYSFWFPIRSALSRPASSRLGGHRSWNTLWWLAVYLLFWQWLLGARN